VHSTPTLMIGSDFNDLEPVADGVISADKLAQAINAHILKTV
jgi:hypothetical protein